MGEQLGELLRTFRSTALLSQETLAERAGLSTRTVSDIETGSAHTPRLVTIMLLAEALGISDADRTRLQDAARKPSQRPAQATHAVANLPEIGALVGRDADVARLGELLARDGTRLLTLVGPAGVGKTTLAVKIASERARVSDAGVTFVELAPILDPSLVPEAVAGALGVRASGDTSATEAVHAFLRDRSLLLILDNVEQLTAAAPWIGELLARCSKLTIIATSREQLHLRAEQVYAVRPLDRESAASLFVQRARMLKPDFAVTPSTAQAIDTIVGHVEGLPLAIELAAPRLLLLPPKALAARLERRLPLLGDGATDRPERQRTMHAAIAWSYDLLSDDEQRLFRRLAVLHGGGTFEAAAAVAGADESERSILMRLATLIDKNMVMLVEDSAGEPRVAMLEMLREYAYECLVESGELAGAQQRHAEYVLAFAQNAHRELSGAAQRHWLARFELEHANVRAALEWALRPEQVVLGFRLLAAVWRFWWMHGYLNEGMSWLRRFLALRSTAGAAVPDALYATVLRAGVVLLSALGNFDEAFALCEEAIALQRSFGDEAGLAASLTSLGIILQFRGDYQAAENAHGEGLAIRRKVGDEGGVATSLSNLSSVAFSRGDLPRAAALGEESVAIYRRLGHESGIAHALTKIGLVAAGERQYARAEEIFSECLRIQRGVGNTGSILYSLINLGSVAHRRSNFELAIARYHEALALLDVTPNKAALAKLFEVLAASIAAVGDAPRAARLFGAADALRTTIRHPVFSHERAEYDSDVAGVRERLDAEAFDVQWRIGASVTLERALEEARETRMPTAANDRNRHSEALSP